MLFGEEQIYLFHLSRRWLWDATRVDPRLDHPPSRSREREVSPQKKTRLFQSAQIFDFYFNLTRAYRTECGD